MNRSLSVLAALVAAVLCHVPSIQAQPLDDRFARVLIPISVSLAPGAYGSIWSTELWYRNNSTYPVQVFPQVISDYVPSVGRTERMLTPIQPAAAPGVFLFVTREYASQVQFDLRVFNRADPFGEWGTKLPVVGETEFVDRVDLINVATGPGVRSALRIYGFSDEDASVLIRIYSNDEELLASAVVPLQGTPRYFGVLSLADSFPSIAKEDRVRVSVESANASKIWAFVTVTSNITQHVAVVTPD